MCNDRYLETFHPSDPLNKMDNLNRWKMPMSYYDTSSVIKMEHSLRQAIYKDRE
jgi:hypothetical protein